MIIDFLIIALIAGGGIVFFAKDAQGSIPPQSQPIQNNPDRLDASDVDLLARTIWGEARSEGYTGMQAVANVIMNRYALAQSSIIKGQQFGFTIEQIVKKPYQFSVWNANDPNLSKMLAVTSSDQKFRAALQIAEKALSGVLPDITGGADHYLNIPVTRQIRGGTLPSWVDLNRKTADIGRHTFLKLA
jgi:N-acetylmuramoyl-L-alanine amidase